MASISNIRMYPIKSLNHVELSEVEIGVRSIQGDRVFAILDENGHYVNGKRTNLVNLLQADFDLSNKHITLTNKETQASSDFELREGNPLLDEYLSDFFGLSVQLIENQEGEFLDIPKESDLTLVSQASLQSIQSHLSDYSLENIRSRFRTNIEIDGVESFWEEKLFLEPGIGVKFRMGEVEMIGVSPRARCNVPPQNPETAEMDYAFVKSFMEGRNQLSQMHSMRLMNYGRSSYFLTVNVILPSSQKGKKLKVGDELEIVGPTKLPAGLKTSRV